MSASTPPRSISEKRKWLRRRICPNNLAASRSPAHTTSRRAMHQTAVFRRSGMLRRSLYSARSDRPSHGMNTALTPYAQEEVAQPEEIFDFYHRRGFELVRLAPCAGRA